jgi:hypothetical protein
MSGRLEQVVGLSRAMLAAAGEGDWEALARLQDERERLLEQAPAAPGDEDALRALIDCNRQLCEAVERERDKVAREWQAAQGRSQAIAAYLSH